MNLDLEFWNPEQESFFWATARNNCFSGGFGNGKTYVACMRQFTMLATFPGYISLFARQYYKSLKSTTMRTFFKICPPDFVLKHDIQEGLTIFTNGSMVLWLHLDAFDEQSLRGLEINSALLDQCEEIQESIYDILNARIGRWDGAIVPESLLIQAVPSQILQKIPQQYLNKITTDPSLKSLKEALIKETQWPRHPKSGRFLVRNFIDVLTNPDNEFHFIYRHYHPDSFEVRKNHFYIERQTDDLMNDPDTITNMLEKDPEWLEKYYYGKWGQSRAQIHKILPISIINPANYSKEEFESLLKIIFTRGALYRVLDHGDSSPTCVLWFAAINKIHICYREYYYIDSKISVHRENIAEFSQNQLNLIEDYDNDIADPSVLYKTQGRGTSKNQFKTSVAEEYSSDDIDGPPIHWSSGDNNEMATRNRINELLKLSLKYAHPITKESPAPALYFIKQCEAYPHGCNQVIKQTQQQRREQIGSDNGKVIYSDNRDETITDHAYDPLRYYVAEHNTAKPQESRRIPERSIVNFENIRRRNARLILPRL